MLILANFIHTNNIPELKKSKVDTEEGQQEVECFNHLVPDFNAKSKKTTIRRIL